MSCNTTKKKELLALLRKEWVTPLIALQKVKILSLSQRCGDFRRDGLVVLDKWVTTDTGARVKAYRLVK